MKRHERPYGCTFYRCHKRFGSKNDWKRHESGQHNLSDVWYSEGAAGNHANQPARQSQLPDDYPQRSGQAAYESASAAAATAEGAFGGTKGRDGPFPPASSFWCGFCRQLMSVGGPSAGRCDQRFHHIDDHFMGRHRFSKQSIGSWVHVELVIDESMLHPLEESDRKRKLGHTGPPPGADKQRRIV